MLRKRQQDFKAWTFRQSRHTKLSAEFLVWPWDLEFVFCLKDNWIIMEFKRKCDKG